MRKTCLLYPLLVLLLLACQFAGGATPIPTPTPAASPTLPPPAPTSTPTLPPPTPTSAPTPEVSSVTVLEPLDGAVVPTTAGPLGPQARFRAQVGHANHVGVVFLSANGTTMARVSNSARAHSLTLDLTWWPWLGNGTYALELTAWSTDSPPRVLASQTVTVQVSDVAGPTLQDRVIGLYRDLGLNITSPVVSHFAAFSQDAAEASRWISVAYVANRLYHVELLDDGTVYTRASWLNSENSGGASNCRPAGHYRILVAFVDYGNTGITQEQAFAAVAPAVERTNQDYAAHAAALGLAEPPLQIEAVPVWISPPPNPGAGTQLEQIQAATGQDPRTYDLVAEVVLDADATISLAIGAHGMSLGGCARRGATHPDLFYTVSDPAELAGPYPLGGLFNHELIHSYGWMHWWPTGDGSPARQFGMAENMQVDLPVLMFGWTDVDGDGTIEILDPTPYGRE
jgi:hypothetical protein